MRSKGNDFMGLTFGEQKDIAYSQGMVERWLERKDVPEQVREAFKTVADGYERLHKQVDQQEDRMAQQEKLFSMQRTLVNAQAQALKSLNDDGWRERVSLEFDEKGACFVFAHSEEGGSFGVGAAYQSNSLSGPQPTLETTPFSVQITLPYLKAIAKLLEVEGNRIPMTRSGSL